MSTVEFFDPANNRMDSRSEELHNIFLADTNQETITTDFSGFNSSDTTGEDTLPVVELLKNDSSVAGEFSSVYINEQTGFTDGIIYTSGPRSGREYQFSRDSQGNITEIAIRTDGTESKQVQEIKLTKSQDASWLVEPPDSRANIPEFQNLKFNENEKGEPVLKGDITVTADGTIKYDRGDGIKEVIRPDGIHDLFDLNEYSRVREVNGDSVKQYWDGYEWRSGEKDPNNSNAVIFYPPEEGKPTRMERHSENDTFQVEFESGLIYDANWRSHKIDRKGGNLPEVSLYPTSQLDSNGNQLWMIGEENPGPEGSRRIMFKPINEGELAKIQNGELPEEVLVSPDSDEVTVRYTNGTRIIASQPGEVRVIEHSNGQRVQLTRDIMGRVIKVEGLGGRTYESQGTIDNDDQPITQWKVYEQGETIGTFNGEVSIGVNGSVDLEGTTGDKINLDNYGRIVTTVNGKPITAIDAQGQTWEVIESENGAETARWKVTGEDGETFFNGELKILENGVIAVETRQGNLESVNQDGSDFIQQGDTLPFPLREPGAHLTGSEFFRDILGVNPAGGKFQNGLIGFERELAILKQIELGNIPDFLRQPKKVTVKDDNGNTAELSVMPDYLAIGSNEDWVRVPVTPILAMAIAERYSLELPTRKVVDTIYNQADKRVIADGLVSNRSDQKYMQGNGFYLKHNKMIETRLSGSNDGALVAGHKKDIIVSRYAESNPRKLDYYGFFDANGQPIQGAGGGAHDNTYVDYSHGVRFIAETVIVNGQPMRYEDVLKNPQLAGLLSDEGTVDVKNIYHNPIHSQYQALF